MTNFDELGIEINIFFIFQILKSKKGGVVIKGVGWKILEKSEEGGSLITFARVQLSLIFSS